MMTMPSLPLIFDMGQWSVSEASVLSRLHTSQLFSSRQCYCNADACHIMVAERGHNAICLPLVCWPS